MSSPNLALIASICPACGEERHSEEAVCRCGERRPRAGWVRDDVVGSALGDPLGWVVGARQDWSRGVGTYLIQSPDGGARGRVLVTWPAAHREEAARRSAVLADLSHPSVLAPVGIGHLGALPYRADPEPAGRTALAGLVRSGAMDWRDVVAVAEQIADALASVHARGIAHGHVGLESVSIEREPDGTLRAELHSFPAYLDDTILRWSAPEVHLGAVADARSDQFGLGYLILCLLRGGEPELPALTWCSGRPGPAFPAPRQRAVPPALLSLLETLLDRDPDRRAPSAAALRRRLARIGAWRRPPRWALAGLGAALVVGLVAVGSRSEEVLVVGTDLAGIEEVEASAVSSGELDLRSDLEGIEVSSTEPPGRGGSQSEDLPPAGQALASPGAVPALAVPVEVGAAVATPVGTGGVAGVTGAAVGAGGEAGVTGAAVGTGAAAGAEAGDGVEAAAGFAGAAEDGTGASTGFARTAEGTGTAEEGAGAAAGFAGAGAAGAGDGTGAGAAGAGGGAGAGASGAGGGAEGGAVGAAGSVELGGAAGAAAGVLDPAALAGRWQGVASGRPLILELSVAGGALSGRMGLQSGGEFTWYEVTGGCDDSGAVWLTRHGGRALRLDGVGTAGRMSGGVTVGGRERGSWSVSR